MEVGEKKSNHWIKKQFVDTNKMCCCFTSVLFHWLHCDHISLPSLVTTPHHTSVSFAKVSPLHVILTTWLLTSRLDMTRSTCWAQAVWLCRAWRTARLDTLVSTRSTRWTCRDVTSQVEFGLY